MIKEQFIVTNKRIVGLVSVFSFAVIFIALISGLAVYKNTLFEADDIQKLTQYINSEILNKENCKIKDVVFTENNDKYFAVLYETEGNEYVYGVSLFKKNFLFKNLYEYFGGAATSSEYSKFYYEVNEKNTREILVVFYGSNNSDNTLIGNISSESNNYFSQVLPKGEFLRIADIQVDYSENCNAYYSEV